MMAAFFMERIETGYGLEINYVSILQLGELMLYGKYLIVLDCQATTPNYTYFT